MQNTQSLSSTLTHEQMCEVLQYNKRSSIITLFILHLALALIYLKGQSTFVSALTIESPDHANTHNELILTHKHTQWAHSYTRTHTGSAIPFSHTHTHTESTNSQKTNNDTIHLLHHTLWDSGCTEECPDISCLLQCVCVTSLWSHTHSI